ncbi:hypothetical protein niasHT_031149 [Heterodera trifolii]|uniref:Uncharacterized protein n=1 Tax=Heterodera trifolii TaxID=157864 RepID=A0ABD2IWV1_9BILA
MIEHGTHTLLDKDWKYVAGCYWQNIRRKVFYKNLINNIWYTVCREESIRRLAKLRAGAAKQPRPAQQMELDDAVSDIIGRRGPNTLKTVLRSYNKWHEDEDEQQQHNQHVQLQQFDHHQTEDANANNASSYQQQQDGAGHQQHHQHQGRNGTAPTRTLGCHESTELLLASNQATLAQLVQNATSSAAAAGAVVAFPSSPPSSSSLSASSTPAKLLMLDNHHIQTPPPHHLPILHHHQHNQLQHRQQNPAGTVVPPLSLPLFPAAAGGSGHCLASFSAPSVLVGVGMAHSKQQQQPSTTTSSTTTANIVHTYGGNGGSASTSSTAANDGGDNSSALLGKLVTRTHSLLLNGTFDGMANEFERQIKQLITGYKAWMFDQLFQQQEDNEEDEDGTDQTLVAFSTGDNNVTAADGTGLASSSSNTTTALAAGAIRTTNLRANRPSSSSLVAGANAKRARMMFQ